MKDLSDIVFCIGDSASKRRNFRSMVSESVIYADNDEIIACLNEDGRTFFALGALPFGDMRVSEFIRYNRMIITRSVWKNAQVRRFIRKACGKSVSTRTKIRTVDVFVYRAIQILSLITSETKEIYVNFDGLPYSDANARRFIRFFRALPDDKKIYVAVSDNRFISAAATVRRYDERGEYVSLSLKADSRVIAGKKLVRSIAERKGLNIERGDIKQIIVSV